MSEDGAATKCRFMPIMFTSNFTGSKSAFSLARIFLPLGSAVIMFLSACGGAQQQAAPSSAPAEPTVAAAARIAEGKAVFIKNGCTACHKIEGVPEAIGAVGPELSRIYANAKVIITQDDYKASKGKAKSAEEYIHESIVMPTAYTSQKCPSGPCVEGVMPATYKDSIPADDLVALTDFLMSLGR
jgi:cytochrome c2